MNKFFLLQNYFINNKSRYITGHGAHILNEITSFLYDFPVSSHMQSFK